MPRQQIGIFFVLLDEAADIAQGIAFERLKHPDIADERRLLDLRLVNRRDAFIKRIEGAYLEVGTEGIAIEQDIVQLAFADELLHTSTIVGYLRPDAAELVVHHLQYSRQTIHAAHVFARDLDTCLVPDIMVDRRPGMLEGSTELQLETQGIARQFADIMQRVIAEAVQLMQFAFVNRVIPVYLKELLRHRRNTIDVIGIESDDTRAKDIRYILHRGILSPFERQFARERLLGLDTRFHRRDNNAIAVQGVTQESEYLFFHALQHRLRLAVLVENHLAMQVERFHY